jgi:1-acyl-sn-glycerol-3-phosphate acyltransferase
MATVKGALAFAFIAVNTVIWCIPIYVLAIPRFLLPGRESRGAVAAWMGRAADGWVASNRLMLKALRIVNIERRIDTAEPLDRNRWYLVISNHQTWADILILQDTFLNRIPPLKFFNKRVLIWVPLIGFAMWLLDFPYVRRYSRAQIEAHPELRAVDQATTAKACETFKVRPTSVLNFLEGTRFTSAKRDHQGSPYRHLLQPKTGGFGYVAASLGERIHQVLDATIYYPHGVPTFWEFLCGRCPVACIEVASRALPSALRAGPSALRSATAAELPTEAREQLRRWIDDVWQRKDERLHTRLQMRTDAA